MPGQGGWAWAALLNAPAVAARPSRARNNGPGYEPGSPGLVHFRAKAKRVIYLFQSGAPSQIDTFDHKPSLEKLSGNDLPDSVRMGQRLTGMTSGQSSFPAAHSIAPFRQHGESGQWISDLLPFHHKIADDICIIKSMFTEAINHDPAITFFQTGHQQPGRPSLGAWASYGLGAESADLPTFVVLLDKNTDEQAQPLYARLWGAGFLPSNHQGVKLRSVGNPVLYLKDPTGAPLADRRRLLDGIAQMNALRKVQVGDPEIDTRIAAYEMAYRMQMSVPELTELSAGWGRKDLRPRPPPALLLDMDGWGRYQTGYQPRRDRRMVLQHRRRRRPRPRSKRHDPALDGNRPRAAHVSIPRPRLPPDRCTRSRGE